MYWYAILALIIIFFFFFFFFADAIYLSLAGEVDILVVVIVMLPYRILANACSAFLNKV
jgi:uncharacterized membrane protein